MKALRSSLVTLLVLAGAAGCGSDDDETPEDVSGAYTVNVTNRTNDCDAANWTEGESASGIQLSIEQEGEEITGTIEGVTALYLIALTGNAEFEGSVSGSSFEMTSYGTTSSVMDGCSFTWNVIIDGSLNGDAIQGTVSYHRSPNDDPDCAEFECVNVQEFSGSRPPK